jgi:FlaA1/EpsC-like NDP-sugar epimerase
MRMTDSHLPEPYRSPSAESPAERDLRIRAGSTIAIFGASRGGEIAYRALAREARIVAFADNARAKWGSQIHGVPVLSPTDLQAAWPQTVVVASQAATAIVDQLQGLGLPRHRIHVFTPSADDLAEPELEAAIADLRGEITALLDLSPEEGQSLRVIIFGAGAGGRDAWARCRGRHRIVAFADNDPKKIGASLLSLPIVAPATLPSTVFDRVVVGSMYFDAICDQLVGLGVSRDQICTVDELMRPGARS